MTRPLFLEPHDLTSRDGKITQLKRLSDETLEAIVFIHPISPTFMGYQIDPSRVSFNLKSTLAQLGVNSIEKEKELDAKNRSATLKLHLQALSPLGKEMLKYISVGAHIGKLFAADERRLVQQPDYLFAMLGRVDQFGLPLLSLGGTQEKESLILEKLNGRTVAFIPLEKGVVSYDPLIESLLPTIGKALLHPHIRTRSLLQLHYTWKANEPRFVKEKDLLLVRTPPLHICTLFAKVVDQLLPPGYHHTSASVLQPDTKASGDIYELFGSSEEEILCLPLEFYTLEPYRAYLKFSDRTHFQWQLQQPSTLFKAYEKAPAGKGYCATYMVKGEQLENFTAKDWVSADIDLKAVQEEDGRWQVEEAIRKYPSYPFLKAIDDGIITSEGVLLLRCFPPPFMKKLLLSDAVLKHLKAIYFQFPSDAHGDFFSHHDRSLLIDLARYGISVFWVDEPNKQILKYVFKPEANSGMFVPLPLVDRFAKAVSFGIYGSNLWAGEYEKEFTELFQGLIAMHTQTNHPLFNRHKPIALVTGGGGGVMEMGNRVAKQLGILSCANIVDFELRKDLPVPEQKQNPYIDAKMTYRVEQFMERQEGFHLDFPIFMKGGIGSDFEFAQEEACRKVGAVPATPILLFGEVEHWKEKITSRFQCNRKIGSIRGSEWVSNCLYCVQTAFQALHVYHQFFEGTLPIGKDGPIYDEGFVITQNAER